MTDISINKKFKVLCVFEGVLALGFILYSWLAFVGPLIEKDKAIIRGTARAQYRLAKIERLKNNFADLSFENNMALSQVLFHLYRFAGISGVELTTVKPGSPAKAAGNGWFYRVLPIAIALRGPQNDVLGFVDSLAQREFLCRVAALSLGADKKQPGFVDGSLTLEKIEDLALPAAAFMRPPRAVSPEDFRSLPDIFKCPEPASKNIPVSAVDENEAVKDLRLIGIYDDGVPRAILEDRLVQKSYILKSGDTIAGCVIAAIGDREVSLSSGTKNYNLEM